MYIKLENKTQNTIWEKKLQWQCFMLYIMLSNENKIIYIKLILFGILLLAILILNRIVNGKYLVPYDVCPQYNITFF